MVCGGCLPRTGERGVYLQVRLYLFRCVAVHADCSELLAAYDNIGAVWTALETTEKLGCEFDAEAAAGAFQRIVGAWTAAAQGGAKTASQTGDQTTEG